MNEPVLRGVCPPVVTPFDEREEVDEGAFRAGIEWCLGKGVHGISVAGSTGEGLSLTDEECGRVYRVAAEAIAGRVPLVAGVIANTTRQAVRRATLAREAGARVLMVTPTPHYLPPTRPGIVAYFRALAAEAGLPILIYNVVPTLLLPPRLLLELSEIDGIAGVKQSGGDTHTLAETLRLTRDRSFTVMTALDDLQLPSYMLGAVGSIGAIDTIVPELSVALYEACQAGRIEEARALQMRMIPVARCAITGLEPGSVTVIPGTKEALRLRGLQVGKPRAPILPCTPEESALIRGALAAAGVLGEG